MFAEENRVIWAAKGTAVNACPKSVITSDSLAAIEQFAALKVIGSKISENVPAKSLDALLVLETEWRQGDDHERR